MYLYEDYLSRKKIKLFGVKHVNKAYVFFGAESNLLSIRWTQKFVHHGLYEISECCLKGKNLKVLDTKRVFWEEYDSFLSNWCKSNSIVFDRSQVFELVWNYFIRKHEKFIFENFYIKEIFETVDVDVDNRIFKIACLLDKISTKSPKLFDYWQLRLSNLFIHYAYWMEELAK